MGPLAGSHFPTIVEGRAPLRALGREALWEGTQEVVFAVN